MNKNKQNTISLTIALFCTSLTLSTDLPTLKQEIQQKFDKAVVEEQAQFARYYGIDLKSLNSELIIACVHQTDKNTKEDIAFYQSEFYKSKIHVQSEALNLIQSLASQIFSKAGLSKVTVLHEPEYELGKVSVSQIYETGKCYTILNFEKYRDNIELLEAILRHECCHLIYEDTLNRYLLQAHAWAKSQDSREKVAYNSLPISRACEMRADVYAILNSTPEQVNAYIEQLQSDEDPEVATTHPKPSERATILQEIIKQLDTVTHL